MEMNGTKRKRTSLPEGATADFPSKHSKPDESTKNPAAPPAGTSGHGPIYAGDDETDTDGASLLPVGTTPGDSPEWQATLETVVKSVVSIHFCQTWSFDTDLSMCSQATGFVVDAERGYILTNRHVVCAGPFWGYCVFDNHEEVNSRILIP